MEKSSDEFEDEHANNSRKVAEMLLNTILEKYGKEVTIDERICILEGMAVLSALLIQHLPDYLQDHFSSVYIDHFCNFVYSNSDEYVEFKPDLHL